MKDPSEISSRKARQDEAAAVARVWLRSRRASGALIPASIHSDQAVIEWFARVVLPERETWVVDLDAAIVAILVLEPGWVDQLYVDPGFTGRGLGSQLLSLAQGLNPEGLDLWTFQSNIPARRFYERRGFVAIAETDGDDNEEGAPDVRYHWPNPSPSSSPAK